MRAVLLSQGRAADARSGDQSEVARGAVAGLGVGGAPFGRVGQHPQNDLIGYFIGCEKFPGHDGTLEHIARDALLDNARHFDVVSDLLVHAASLFGFVNWYANRIQTHKVDSVGLRRKR